MAPLRFRAWVREYADNGEFVRAYMDLSPCFTKEERVSKAPCTVGFVAPINDCFQDPSIVYMQSTGLTDKNGLEVFEGDIVSLDGNMTADNSMGVLPNGWTFDEDSKYAIVWSEEVAGWRLDFSKSTFKDVEKEFGDLSESYIRKYKNHAMSLLVDRQTAVIGNIYENPDLLPS